MGKRNIIRSCEDAKPVTKSSQRSRTTIKFNGFVVQGADITPSPCLQDHPEKGKNPGIRAKRVGQKTFKTLASKRVLEIHLGTVEQVRSKIVISRSGGRGEKKSTKETTILVSSAINEEGYSTPTILNALLTIQNSALKLVTEGRFAEIVIRLRPHMDTTNVRHV